MNYPPIVSRDEWLVAREALLIKEKEATRARDRLNAERRRLPMVKIDKCKLRLSSGSVSLCVKALAYMERGDLPIALSSRLLLAWTSSLTSESRKVRQSHFLPVFYNKDYFFEGPHGRVSLLDLFEGRRQLIIYHFMFGPDWEEGCPVCSFLVDNIGHLTHLYARDTSLVLVSRAPSAKIEPFKTRMGWSIPWVSSYGSDFNYDFGVTNDEGEMGGLSVFLHHGEDIFHTYSTNGRGVDILLETYNYLDLTPLGRQESWEEPAGRSAPSDDWLRYHDQYDA